MPSLTYHMRVKLWLWPGEAAWHFVTLPKAVAKEVRALMGDLARGFGSLPVTVTLGSTTWKTSIFPESKSGSYVLPVKAAVRKAERVTEGDRLDLVIKVSG